MTQTQIVARWTERSAIAGIMAPCATSRTKASATIRSTATSRSPRRWGCRRARSPSSRSSTTPGCSGCGRSTSCRPPGGSFPRPSTPGFSTCSGRCTWPAGRSAALYDSLREVCPDVPSRGYVESLMRMAALVARRGARAVRPLLRRALPGRLRPDHETLGGEIIRRELGDADPPASAAIPTAGWPTARRSIPSRSPS